MAEEDERVVSGLDAVEMTGRAQDPEKIQELQEMQRMYERIADELRGRKNIPFSKILSRIRSQAEEQATEGTEEESGLQPGEGAASTGVEQEKS